MCVLQGQGGAINQQTSGTLSLTNCDVSYNGALYGGGVSAGLGVALVTDTTDFTYNRADGYAGAIECITCTRVALAR